MASSRRPVSEAISDALLSLMEEKPFIDITVTDVVKRAGVARASFYRNFSSTSDILDSILDGFKQEFIKNALPVITSQDERQWRAFLFRYLYFLVEHQNTLMLTKNSNISIVFYRMIDAARDLSLSLPNDDINQKYRVPSRIGAINSTIFRWIDAGKKETPEELVDYMMSFVLDI